MKIFLSIYSKIFIVSTFALIGCIVIPPAVEYCRIIVIGDIKENFSKEDISYHDMSSLRNAFHDKENEIEGTITEINELIKKHPQNSDFKRKLANYEKYRQSMLATLFPCPEHITSSETCDECKGKGGGWLWTCKKCKGKGVVEKNCPNCGAVSPSWIYGKDL